MRALVVVLAMAVAAVGVLWLQQAGTSAAAGQLASQEPQKVAVPPLAGATASASAPGGPTAAAVAPSTAAAPSTAGRLAANPGPGPPGGSPVVVHVAGAVKHPGVYTLPSGSRLQQAVAAAGGALPGAVLEALNLAAAAVDGTQILVPTRAQVDARTGDAAGNATGGIAGSSPGGFTGGAPGSSDGPAAGTTGSPLDLNSATVEQLDALPGVGPVLAGRIVAWRTDHGPFTSVDELDAVSGIGAKMLANLRPLVAVR